MGKGVCSRRQRKLFQSFFLITVVCGMICAFMISYEMHKELKKTEAVAVRYQQHQASLSAQLQVVYEHHSRLEKSLQKERLEHKKSKEDYIGYKVESERFLNKEKQDSANKLKALQTEHEILKNQHEDLKKAFDELQEKHQSEGEGHAHAVDEHRIEVEQMQREKEMEISRLKENAYNLREENRQLRRAHQNIHTQLMDVRQQHKDLKTSNDRLTLLVEDHKSALAAVQLQVEEFKKLKDTLVKKSSIHNVAQIPKLVSQLTKSYTVGTTEPRPDPHQEQGHPHNQINTKVSPKAEERLKISHHSLHIVREMGNDIEEQKEFKQAQWIDLPHRGEEKGEKRAAPERGEEEKRIKPEPVRSLSDTVEMGPDYDHKQSQTDEEQKRETERVQRPDIHFETLEPVIVSEGESHSNDKKKVKDEINDIETQERVLRQKEVNPGDDPDNQGEDEFEVTEEEVRQEETQKAEHTDRQPAERQERVEEDEHLVVRENRTTPGEEMAENPDRQEDNLDEQYEEDVEEEALDDLMEDKQPKEEEVEGEDYPYGEDNVEEGTWKEEDGEKELTGTRTEEDVDNREENYEEHEVVEGEGPGDRHSKQRAEM